MTTHGRCVQITSQIIVLQNESEFIELPNKSYSFAVGDILELHDGDLRLLTKQTSPGSRLSQRILDPRRRKAMQTRRLVERQIHDYFHKQQFHEVRTPLMVRSPGMEAHIDPFELRTGQFLPSSPEFAMKKLLVGGLEKIYQICSAFRDEPFSQHHRPEFTMLEFYRAFANDEEIQKDIENIVSQIAQEIHGSTKISFQERTIDLATPWPRLKINELFVEFAKIDLRIEDTAEKLKMRAEEIGVQIEVSDSWDEIYFRIWLEKIEPLLPTDRAVFVTHYPPSQAALAKLDADGWARRFEAYIGGIELCNGFDELTDAQEQRLRFAGETETRKKKIELSGKPLAPIDEEFLMALEEGLPPSGGVALGVDRLVMLMADENDIEFCFWLNPQQNT